MVVSGAVFFFHSYPFSIYICLPYIHVFSVIIIPMQSIVKKPEWILGVFKIHNGASRVEGTSEHAPLLTLQGIAAQLGAL